MAEIGYFGPYEDIADRPQGRSQIRSIVFAGRQEVWRFVRVHDLEVQDFC